MTTNTQTYYLCGLNVYTEYLDENKTERRVKVCNNDQTFATKYKQLFRSGKIFDEPKDSEYVYNKRTARLVLRTNIFRKDGEIR